MRVREMLPNSTEAAEWGASLDTLGAAAGDVRESLLPVSEFWICRAHFAEAGEVFMRKLCLL